MIKPLTRLIFANHRNYLITLLSVILIALALAHLSEAWLALKPCKLCHYQRYIYYAMVVVMSLGLIIFPQGKPLKLVFLVSILLLIAEVLIAGYHTGIEFDIFSPWQGCFNHSEATDLAQLKQDLLNATAVTCEKVTFRFLGLSLAAWNYLFSLLLLVISIYYFFLAQKDNNKSVTD